MSTEESNISTPNGIEPGKDTRSNSPKHRNSNTKHHRKSTDLTFTSIQQPDDEVKPRHSKRRATITPHIKQNQPSQSPTRDPKKNSDDPSDDLWQQVKDYRSYFGSVGLNDCELLLVKNGDFLLRSKHDFPTDDKQLEPVPMKTVPLLLTVKLQGRSHHYLIHIIGPNKSFSFGGMQMGNLEELMEHHIKHKIPLPVKGSDAKKSSSKDFSRSLKRAIMRPPTNFGPEENIIFEEAEDSSSLSRDNESGGHDFAFGTINKQVPFINEINKANDKKILIKTWQININTCTLSALTAMVRIQKLYTSNHLLAAAGFIHTSKRFHLIYPRSDYGSLYAYLRENKDIPVRHKFKISNDIADGMSCLEKLKVTHGKLTSKHCIMGYQGNRVLVTDFKPIGTYLDGLRQARITSFTARYMAIEIIEALQNKSLSHDQMTLAADCWSYGTIVYEVFSEETPYSNFNTAEIFNFITSGYRLDPVLAGDEIRDCIRSCFETNPVNRPTFKLIQEKIEALYLGLLKADVK